MNGMYKHVHVPTQNVNMNFYRTIYDFGFQ